MWSELAPAWQACLEEAWTAYCAGSLPIGAVVTGPDGEIVARGRNHRRDPAGCPGQVGLTILAHAELNALLVLPFGIDIHFYHIYTTTEPCPMCMGAIYMSGVRHIHYASRDPYGGSTNVLRTTPYYARKPVKTYGPERSDLEDLLAAMHTEALLTDLDGDKANAVMEAYQSQLPAAVALGKAWYASGWLRRLAQAGISPVEAVEQISAQIINSHVQKPSGSGKLF